MLPPTLSLASVTKNFYTLSECLDYKARAVVIPQIPAPTTTESYISLGLSVFTATLLSRTVLALQDMTRDATNTF